VVSDINRLCIKKAKQLVREGGRNLSEAPQSVGFPSLHYFSKIFKPYEQKSPTEYFATIKSKLEI